MPLHFGSPSLKTFFSRQASRVGFIYGSGFSSFRKTSLPFLSFAVTSCLSWALVGAGLTGVAHNSLAQTPAPSVSTTGADVNSGANPDNNNSSANETPSSGTAPQATQTGVISSSTPSGTTTPQGELGSKTSTPNASSSAWTPSPSTALTGSGAGTSFNKVAPESPPKWVELTPSQQRALQPLNSLWSSITTAHKRKWIALIANFSDLSDKDQEKLQQRMKQWASLSAQERAQARVIFTQVQQLTADDRLSKWQAYQALEPSQKNQLAQSTPLLPNSAAISPKPIVLRSEDSIHLLISPTTKSTRLAVDQLASHTLLPPKVASPAP
jgi:Protein of unknown function (DUF3106)